MPFLKWKRCEGVSSLEELDSIYGGVEGSVAETYGLDGMYPLKEESMLEVALGPRSRWNMLVVVMMESNELKYESRIQ